MRDFAQPSDSQWRLRAMLKERHPRGCGVHCRWDAEEILAPSEAPELSPCACAPL